MLDSSSESRVKGMFPLAYSIHYWNLTVSIDLRLVWTWCVCQLNQGRELFLQCLLSLHAWGWVTLNLKTR